MPKKKQPRNAFYFFMLHYKSRGERNGEVYPNGLRDVQDEAGREWNSLPSSHKKEFEDMAKAEKAKLKGDTSQKLTCWHTPFQVVDNVRNEEEDFKLEMNNYIKNTVENLAMKNMLAEHKFYLAHVNYFCISEGECYHPAELAISEFSLAEGVTDVYNTIIDPGEIPLGYRSDAIQKSENFHKIPVQNIPGEQNFYNILNKVKRFLEPGRAACGGAYPPVYTMPDNLNLNTSYSAVKSVLKTLLSSDTGSYDENMFRVYSLEKLFLELWQACNKDDDNEAVASIPAVSVARAELERDIFNYIDDIACEFHYQQEAVNFCSKSYVQRWVYLICDHCCGQLNITIIPGRHVPYNADVNFQQKKLEEQKEKTAFKPIAKPTQIDHSRKPSTSTSSWVARKQAPLPRPQKEPNLKAMLPSNLNDEKSLPSNLNDEKSYQEEFPSIVIGRGRAPGGNDRGRGGGYMGPGGSGRGNPPLSFAAASKK